MSEFSAKLLDRGDGVKGHYCIGRQTGDYMEFWNDKEVRWCSAGTVYKKKVLAEDKLRWLKVTKFLAAT